MFRSPERPSGVLGFLADLCVPTDHFHVGSLHMQFCQYVVAYEEEPAGSDVADPRVRCGKPATIELESGLWCCPEHAEIVHDSLDRPDKPFHS